MSNPSPSAADSPKRWWGLRLPLYNLALLTAGPIAYFCYMQAIYLFRSDLTNDPGFDPGGIAFFFQAIGYVTAMVLANICYWILGPCLESFVKPGSPNAYRQFFFWTGTLFSVALPFGIPAMVALKVSVTVGGW